MTTTLTAQATDWIILTPSPDDAAWRAAIEAACHATGRTFAIAAANIDPAGAVAPAVTLTDDPALIPAEAANIIALIPDPGQAVSAWLTSGQPIQECVWQASRRIVDAIRAPNLSKVVGQTAIKSGAAGIKLFDGVTVVPPPATPVSLDSDIERGAADVLNQIANLDPADDAASMRWPTILFGFDAKSRAGFDTAGTMDTTGRPRFLVYGPYMAMPKGRWQANIRFSVDDDACHRNFRIDWGGVTEFTSHTFRPERSGVYEISLEHEWTETAPAEIRFVLLEGSFSGIATFNGATITRVRDEP